MTPSKLTMSLMPVRAPWSRDFLCVATPGFRCDEFERQIALRIVANAAREHFVESRDVFSSDRYLDSVEARRKAIIRVSEAFPFWSTVRLARFFQKDHTTILHALGRTWKSKRQLAAKLERLAA